ncbi:MAG: DUF3800 domain-containing protein [Candidatus Promineifilaceae bacterium]|nr:DUF3800 domain-containing protein [Candidatus Promineifilaceae bacterium]
MNQSDFPACTHVAFADECNYNDKHSYPSIALISLSAFDYAQMSSELSKILKESNIQEFKRNKLKTAKYRFAALEFVQFAVQQVMRKKMRIDVLIWDWTDSRHSIKGIDRIQNFQRLYYQLLKNTLCARWENDAVWLFFPDQQSALDWFVFEEFLDMASVTSEVDVGLLGMGGLKIRLKREFRIAGIEECDSQQEPIVQLADLFAGLASFSRSNYHKIEYWEQTGDDRPQLLLPGLGPKPIELSAKDKEHCRVILELNALCKQYKLGVSLKGHQGLRTPNPEKPINFWWYVPQHEFDKAPTKNAIA